MGYKCIFTTYKGTKSGFEPFLRERLYYVFDNIDKLINKGIFEISVGEVWEKLGTRKNTKKNPKSKRKPLTKSIRHEVFSRIVINV